MLRSRILRPRSLVLFALLLVFAAASYGFANSNTLPASVPGAGDGQATISGYKVTGVQYVLNTTDPSKIDTVKLTFDNTAPLPVTVKMRLDTLAASPWYSCTMASNVATCTTTNATVAGANNLQVVAIGN